MLETVTTTPAGSAADPPQDQPATTKPSRLWVLASVGWALAPLLLALPAGPFFGWAAWRLRSRVVAVEAALYGSATVAFFALTSQPSGTVQNVGVVVGLGVMVVATVRAFVLRARVFRLRSPATGTETGGTDCPPPPGWTPVFPASSVGAPDPDRPATWIAPLACNGRDQHLVSLPAWRTIGYVFGGASLIAVQLYLHVYGRGLGIGIGLLLTPLFVVLFSRRLDGPVLYYRNWGVRRAVRLDRVSAVATTAAARYATLLLSAQGVRRPVRVSLRSTGYVAPPAVADHLRGWLERPGVQITPAASAVLSGEFLTAHPSKRPSRLYRALAVLLGVVLPLSALGLGVWLSHQRQAELRIPGAPGYSTFGGPHGKPLAVGRPWGRPCQPVRFTVEQDVPDWVYNQVAAVVAEARADGIDVTVETRNFYWTPSSLYYPAGQTPETVVRVPVFSDDATPPRLRDGQPERILLGWDAAVDPDGTHEDVTSEQGVLHLAALNGDLPATRRAIRQLVALSQGIEASTSPESGIRQGSTQDRFTPADVNAMRTMSGCGAAYPSAP
ncbi:MAG TPA: hypothetical protein VFA11_11765 [Acidimicrobiales bacterium]|nr:hypothetical protein [Acidimicrobiales bacterium]